MKQHICLLIVAACALALAGSPATAVADTGTVKGEIEVVQYDEDGNVVEVAIFDNEWGSILVVEGGVGAELLDHVGAIVSATGDLLEHDDDPHPFTIKVTSYTIEEPAEPDVAS